MTTATRNQEGDEEDFGKEILGDDNALKTNPDDDVKVENKGKKKKILLDITAKEIKDQDEPVSNTLKNKYKSLIKNLEE